jgi:peptidoglycan DL-endopeptidase CwlO
LPAQRSPLGAVRVGRAVLAALVVLGVVLPATAAHADPSIAQIQQQIQVESTRLEKIVEQYNKLNEQLKATQAQAVTLAARLGPLQQQMDAASDRISAMSAQAYRGADMVSTEALLTSGAPAEFIDRMSTLDHVARAQQQLLDQFIAAKRQHDANSVKLASTIRQLDAQRDALAAHKAQITKDLAHLYQLRKEAYGRIAAARAAAARAAAARAAAAGLRSPAAYTPGRAGIAVRYAYGALGKPYEWGADGPNSYDCSGLTMAAWRAAGVQLPHNAEMQWHAVPHLSRSQLRPGDLVFYENLGHVAIYVGNGQIVQAPTFGETVKVSPIDILPPYGYGRPS